MQLCRVYPPTHTLLPTKLRFSHLHWYPGPEAYVVIDKRSKARKDDQGSSDEGNYALKLCSWEMLIYAVTTNITYMHVFAPSGGDSENEEQSEPDKNTSTKRLTAL